MAQSGRRGRASGFLGVNLVEHGFVEAATSEWMRAALHGQRGRLILWECTFCFMTGGTAIVGNDQANVVDPAIRLQAFQRDCCY